MRKITFIIIFLLIFLFAAALRLYGLRWDSGTQLHPDERFLTMVTNDISWPETLSAYFDTSISPLNPQNNNHSFFVYGTWPLFVTKAIAERVNMSLYGDIPIVGRTLSALFDLGTLMFVFLITKFIAKKTTTALLAMFLYAISVVPIQLSHFYAVDTFAVFWMTVTIFFLVRKNLGVALGIALGMAVSSKITGILLFPAIGIAYISQVPKKKFWVILTGLVFLVSFILTVRVAYPYLFDGFSFNPKVLQNWKELKTFDGDNTGFPPALQWIGTKPVLYPLSDLIVWGLGIPLGILTLLSLVASFFRLKYEKTILLVWIFTVFIYQSIQFAKAMRYMAPIYPELAVLTALFLMQISKFLYSKIHKLVIVYWILVIGLLLVWPLSFVNIYSKETTRLTASKWIYDHIPPGATLAWEQWDDPLPLSVGNHQISEYKTIPLAMYDPDTSENVERKWIKLSEYFSEMDYLVLSSNRVYGGITRAKKRFPTTYNYYKGLFDGTLGFEKVMEFTTRPSLPLPFGSLCLLPPGQQYGALALPLVTCLPNTFEIVDDFAEESFTVYDHPKVIIMKNVDHISAEEFMRRITITPYDPQP